MINKETIAGSGALAAAEARKRRAAPPDARIYQLATCLSWLIFQVWVGPRVEGLEQLPKTGALLIVANHLSYLEPPLIGGIIRRRITFLALHELWEIRWLTLVLRLLGALPVKRGGARDLDAIRATLELLKQGEAVAIFPEGERSLGPGLLRANPGISLLASRSQAPILPIAITGTEQLASISRFLLARRQRPRVVIRVGKPFYPELSTGRLDHQAVADSIMSQVAALLPGDYRGHYG